jgi:hypothetical protein
VHGWFTPRKEPQVARTYTGTARKSFQDALDKAVASALRAAGGADRSIKWTLKSVSGRAGGIAPTAQTKVSIESTVE